MVSRAAGSTEACFQFHSHCNNNNNNKNTCGALLFRPEIHKTKKQLSAVG